MSTSTHDEILNAQTTMGPVTLRVGDMQVMSDYYSGAFALEPLEEEAQGNETHRVLGRGQTPFVRLIHTPNLPAVDPRQAGLFHTAFLFDDAAGLAATVYRAAQDRRGTFTGSSDHLVSEAFYFTDPEGNGVELYTDRPREQWTRVDGEIQMDTIFLDPNAFLREHLSPEAVTAAPTQAGTVGHVHLQVGDLATARAFYIDTLGFEITQSRYPGALFASAGGYHHHIAMNTWNSRGAGPRAAQLGLADVSITVPDRSELDAVAERLRRHNIDFASDGRTLALDDPWGTRVTLAMPGVATDELMAR
ncbi:VOC family protein [Leucobacter sp. VD1]|uniref:VOC family protein n=1 Tax=Leucobacter sp. VD1 TaxID=3080381 RepID=UPI0030166ACC